MKNVGFLVSGEGSNLQAVIDSINNKSVNNANIVTVISSRENAYALERAKINNIDSMVIARSNINLEDYTKQLLEYLKIMRVELIVMAGFTQIVGEELVSEYANRIINIHPSILPFFGGKGMYGIKVHEAVIKSKARITGATTHFVTDIIDRGPIILQKEIHINENDTPLSLQQRVKEEAEWLILPKTIDLYCNEKLEVKDNYVLKK